MNLKKTAKFLFSSLFLFTITTGFAQKSDLVHQNMHRDLLADQINMYKEINLLDSISLIYRLQDEESEFPSLDLYGSWDNKSVDPFRGMSVKLPDSLKIDMS